jgi:hypothetical protein
MLSCIDTLHTKWVATRCIWWQLEDLLLLFLIFPEKKSIYKCNKDVLKYLARIVDH